MPNRSILTTERTRPQRGGATPQSQPIPGRPEMVQNSAGGYVFDAGLRTRLERFLILGTEAPTYYASPQKLTKDAVGGLRDFLKADGPGMVRIVRDISVDGRAPKQDPALFALALAAAEGDAATKRAVREAFPAIVRTGTHLFHFADFATQFRGWGRFLRELVASWYESRDAGALTYQVTKYQGRDGWTNQDLLRLSHAKPGPDPEKAALFRWIARGYDALADEQKLALPDRINAIRALHAGASNAEAVRAIREHRLTREELPTHLLAEKSVWEALLAEMPITALVRNLATLTRRELLQPLSETERLVVGKLTDRDRLRKGRVHPVALLLAKLTYAQGGEGGGKSRGGPFAPNRRVLDALEDAFYASFAWTPGTGKRNVLAVDVSGSMWGGTFGGLPVDEGTAACIMALVIARTEEQFTAMAFANGFVEMKLSKTMNLDAIVAEAQRLSRHMSGTDCAQPMLWATKNRIPAEAFSVFTDNETWAGRIQPVQALQQHRQAMGVDAKLAVFGFTATGFTIADPKDGGMMDFVGFDAVGPKILADFFRGAAADGPATGDDDAPDTD